MKHFTLYINGQWTANEHQEFSVSMDPATNEVVGEYCLATREQVNEAIEAANQAFKKWRKTPAPIRAAFFTKVIEGLRARKMELAEMMTKEMGKVLSESLGEVEVVIQNAEYMQAEGRRMLGVTVPSSSPTRTIRMIREPLGVVACITPWNFPVSLAAYKIFSGLVSGNTVVWKPASEVPLSAKILSEIISEAGLPNGVFNLITGSGSMIGNIVANHKDVNVIAFTGSTETGIALSKQASETLKRVSLELGGKNAVIVLKDAKLEEAATGIIQSAFTTTGQRCTAASRVIVERVVKDELLKKLIEKTKALRIGNGLEEGNQIGPIVSKNQLESIEQYIKIAQEEGGKLEVGGKRLSHLSGNFLEPAIISNVKPTDTIAQEEIFGPVLAIIEVDSYEEAMEINNNTIYGLSTSLYTESLHFANKASHDAISGLVYINSGTSNAEMGVAFGGMKMSGNGHREVSYHSLDVMTEWKSIYTNY